MVSPEEWGPNAWELLHGISEKIGNQSTSIMINDERNELKLTLRHFWALLPCQKCQKHYKEWIQKSSPDSLINGAYLDIQDSIRKWVFALHENVNTSRGIQSDITLEEVKERYNTISIKEKAKNLKNLYQRGILIRVLKPEEWKVAWKHLDALVRIIS
jgi:hypothetical protein